MMLIMALGSESNLCHDDGVVWVWGGWCVVDISMMIMMCFYMMLLCALLQILELLLLQQRVG